MANIQTYLNKIKNAIYGRDVRDSIHDAIDAINTESENTKDIIEDFVGGELDTTLTSTTLPAQGKAVGDAVADLKSQIEITSNIVDGVYYTLKGALNFEYPVSIPNGTKVRITNNSSANASGVLRNSDNEIIQNFGTINANGGTIEATVTVDGVVKYTGYCVNGYNAILFVENSGSLVITTKKNEENIGNLSNSVNSIENDLYPIKEDQSWEQGGINVATGAFGPFTYRIRTPLPEKSIKISANQGFNFAVFAFDGEEYIGVWNGSTFEKVEHWDVETLDVTNIRSYNYNYWVVGGFVNNARVVPSDGSNISISLNTLLCIKDELNDIYLGVLNYSPNMIFQCRNVDDETIPPESKWYIKAAAENQYDRVRCTVRKTTDGYYFMCHDDNINNVARNSDGSVISESVSANGKTLAELNQYDWGIKYGAQYAGATVPLLTDFLKYAAIFNLGVTWHSATTDVETDSALSEQFDLIDKYGLTDNLIVITSNGHNFGTMEKILARNPRISYYIGGESEFFANETNVNRIKELQTTFNHIYVQLFPWGTTPTDEFISFAKENNFLLYDSITMSEQTLLNENMFNKGYSLREVNNVKMIKTTIRKWANSLIR